MQQVRLGLRSAVWAKRRKACLLQDVLWRHERTINLQFVVQTSSHFFFFFVSLIVRNITYTPATRACSSCIWRTGSAARRCSSFVSASNTRACCRILRMCCQLQANPVHCFLWLWFPFSRILFLISLPCPIPRFSRSSCTCSLLLMAGKCRRRNRK